MRISVDTADGLVDSLIEFNVFDTPAEKVELVVDGVDAAGSHWRSRGTHRLGDDGRIELADPDLPWWDMRLVDNPSSPDIFESCDGTLDFTVSVSDGTSSAKVTVPRTWGREHTVEQRRGDGWQLQIYRPESADYPLPGIIVFPGTMVTRSVTAMAALLAAHGYVAAVLFYTQRPGLPDSFSRIATENIAAGIEYFAALPCVDEDRIALHASSVGVQTALSTMVTMGTPARAVVAVAPSHVVFQALRRDGPPEKVSALTHGGVDLPYVPVRSERLLGQLAMNLLRRKISHGRSSMAMSTHVAYAAGLRDHSAVRAATIAVEKIGCPMLVAAGTDDQCYPAADMAQEIVRRRSDEHAIHAADDELLIYPRVGHFIRPPAIPTTVTRSASLIGGGDPRHIAAAQRDCWTRTLAFLHQHLT